MRSKNEFTHDEVLRIWDIQKDIFENPLTGLVLRSKEDRALYDEYIGFDPNRPVTRIQQIVFEEEKENKFQAIIKKFWKK